MDENPIEPKPASAANPPEAQPEPPVAPAAPEPATAPTTPPPPTVVESPAPPALPEAPAPAIVPTVPASAAPVEVTHTEVGHADVGHADVGHADVGHADVGHADVGHADVGHADVGSDHEAHNHEYPRFRLMARIEHMVLLVSFTILCLTGLPQKFPFSPISQGLINLMGGIEVVRYIHRWAAIVLILGTIYHLLTSAYRLFVKHEDMRMLPDLKDGLDLRDTVAYNLGFIDEPPKMRKFNFGEKFEYWAVVWGTAVMIITGFILWNPIAATRILPGQFIPVALEAHGWEAVLAAVSIVIWHLYNVLVKHRNLSMFTGVLSHKIMEEEHGLELERLDEGGDPWKVIPPDVLARRRRVYFVVAGVVVALALALVVWMFTFEETAITTLPAATREVFVPLATPTP